MIQCLTLKGILILEKFIRTNQIFVFIFQEIFGTQTLLVHKSEKIVRSQNATGGHG